MSETNNYGSPSAIATNPSSAVFKQHYELSPNNLGSFLISFDGIEKASTFVEANMRSDNISVSEYASDQLGIQSSFATVDRIVLVFTIVFSVVAAIIMVGTVSRVIDDERQTIALYRAVGASSKDVMQVFLGYVFAISLLVVVCSTITGLAISSGLALFNSALVAAHISVIYNMTNVSKSLLVGFSPSIILIHLVIVAVGLLCLFLVSDRLASKNIIKDLRR